MATETVTERTVVLQPGDVYLRAEQARTVRGVLLVGLTAYGEIEQKVNAANTAKMCGHPWPEEAIPLEPSAHADSVSEFAAALSYIEGWQP